MKYNAYIFDLDGTLCNCSHRLPFITGDKKDWDAFYAACGEDKPINDVIWVLQELNASDATCLFVTGRPEAVQEKTIRWLWDNAYVAIPGGHVYMRKDGDHRPDYEIKREIYEQKIKDNYKVIGVFEDRQQCVDMWRSLGLTVFQVANGDY